MQDETNFDRLDCLAGPYRAQGWRNTLRMLLRYLMGDKP